MDKTFKWHMLITSFLPLWISIIIIDIWEIVIYGKNNWNIEIKPFLNIWEILLDNIILVLFVLIIIINAIVSTVAINKFLKLQKKNTDNLNSIKLLNVKKSSNLSPEYLIAYILPMLVFDFTSPLHLLLFILYFSTFSFLSIRNNHVYINIYLEFKKYKIFTADISSSIMNIKYEKNDCIVLSKKDLCQKNDEEIKTYDLENTIYLDVTKEN